MDVDLLGLSPEDNFFLGLGEMQLLYWGDGLGVLKNLLAGAGEETGGW